MEMEMRQFQGACVTIGAPDAIGKRFLARFPNQDSKIGTQIDIGQFRNAVRRTETPTLSVFGRCMTNGGLASLANIR
jgi:hypothetical protein